MRYSRVSSLINNSNLLTLEKYYKLSSIKNNNR